MTRRDNRRDPMRIVHVTPSYFPCVGGCERRVQEVSERLVARGHDITVLTLDCATQRDFFSPRGAGLLPTELLNGVKLVRVSPNGGKLGGLLAWCLARRGGWRTLNWLAGSEFEFFFGRPCGLGLIPPLLLVEADVVSTINWCVGSAFWSWLALRPRRIPQVAVPVLHIDQPWAQRQVYSHMFKGCRAAIVATDAEQDFVRARGITSVTVAGGGVEPSRFEHRDGAAIRARYGLGSRPVVGFVGRQDYLKGVPNLVDAMRKVWPEAPETVLLLAGPKAHRDSSVTDKLASLSVAESQRVLLIDDFTDDDGPSIIDACDLLAQPSVEESFGQVLVQAWMCGKPVIGADIAATRRVIDHDANGWLVKPFDAENLAARILRLLAEPETRTAFGECGRAKAIAQYTWDHVTDGWEATYRRVVNGSG